MPTSSDDVSLTMIDGRDALFGLVLKDAGDGHVTVDMFGTGLSRADAILALRQLANQMEANPGSAKGRVGPAESSLSTNPAVVAAREVLAHYDEVSAGGYGAGDHQHLANALRGLLRSLGV